MKTLTYNHLNLKITRLSESIFRNVRATITRAPHTCDYYGHANYDNYADSVKGRMYVEN